MQNNSRTCVQSNGAGGSPGAVQLNANVRRLECLLWTIPFPVGCKRSDNDVRFKCPVRVPSSVDGWIWLNNTKAKQVVLGTCLVAYDRDPNPISGSGQIVLSL